MNPLTRVLHLFSATLVAAQVIACTPLDPASSRRDADLSAVVEDDAGDTSSDSFDASSPESDSGVASWPEGGAETTEAGIVSESCAVEATLRCGASAGTREVCKGGVWTRTMACPEGQVCTAQGSTPGGCQTIAEVCKGSANMAVCDGQGVLYRCDAVGVATSQDNCRTPQLCQASIAQRSCLKCMPDEHRCNGAILERCTPDGSGFALAKTCSSAALCNASARDCTTQACTSGSVRCQGDNLQRCNAGQTAYELVKACKPGFCSEARNQCDECVPNAASCEEDIVATCSADGRTVTRAPCMAPTSQCVGVGRCVQCGRDADCADPGTCKTRHCNLATGMCAPTNQAARASCGTDGLCDGAGTCGECLADADCPNPGDCRTRSCNRTTRRCEPKNIASGTTCSAGVCNGAGACVGCTAATVSRCTSMTCQTASCTNGQCAYARTATGQRGNCMSGQVCSAAATCAECTTDSHCQGKGFDGPCSTARCMNGHCGGESRSGLSCGQRMVCSGNNCIPSCGNGTVDPGEACDPGPNGDNILRCSPDCQTRRNIYLPCNSEVDCGASSLDVVCVTFAGSGGGFCAPNSGYGFNDSPAPGAERTACPDLAGKYDQGFLHASSCVIECSRKPCPPGLGACVRNPYGDASPEAVMLCVR